MFKREQPFKQGDKVVNVRRVQLIEGNGREDHCFGTGGPMWAWEGEVLVVVGFEKSLDVPAVRCCDEEGTFYPCFYHPLELEKV